MPLHRMEEAQVPDIALTGVSGEILSMGMLVPKEPPAPKARRSRVPPRRRRTPVSDRVKCAPSEMIGGRVARHRLLTAWYHGPDETQGEQFRDNGRLLNLVMAANPSARPIKTMVMHCAARRRLLR
jgi:PAB1-binding protein PBP1